MEQQISKTLPSINGQNDTQEMAEIDLLDLFSYYMSKLPLLIAAILAGAIIAGAFTVYMIPNRYTAVSRMYMISASSDSVVNLSDLNIGASLSNDYVELMKSRPVLEDVIEKLGLDYTYEQLSGMISLNVVTNTRIVRISATSTDPQEAMDIANQMAVTSKERLPKVMDAPSPSIAESAVFPKYRSSPSLSRNVLTGAAALLFCVLAFLTLLYMLDDTVKSGEDVEKTFGIMPLAVIPEAKIEGLQSRSESDRGIARRWRKKRKKGGKDS